MNNFEIFVLIFTGFVAGLSVLSGFAAAAVRYCFQSTWSRMGEVAWIVVACGNIMFCTLGVVVIFAYSVVGAEGMGRPDFWLRSMAFGVGVAMGFGLALIAGSLVYRKINGHINL